MKKMLPLFLAALVGLASCSKADDPAAKPTVSASIVGTWTWASDRTVTTYANGQPSTTSEKTIVPGSVTLTYQADGSRFTTVNGVSSAPVAGTLPGLGQPVASTRNGFATTTTLTELTANKMVTVIVDQSAAVTYTNTVGYTR